MTTASESSRVIAFFVVNGKDVEIHGTILKTLSDKSGQVYYELHTDIPVHFQVRDQEIKLKVHRATTADSSLFVRTDQCFPENPAQQDPPPLPPNHPTAPNGDAREKSRFVVGDLITLPLETTNRLINGSVGYYGLYQNREVVELCADPKENSSGFISSIRDQYEVHNFPDHLRRHDMKGFSLIVDASFVIPRHDDGPTLPSLHRAESFSQPVSSNPKRNSSISGYPRK